MAFIVDSPHNEAHRQISCLVTFQAVESDRRPPFKMYDLAFKKYCLSDKVDERDRVSTPRFRAA